MAATEYVEKTNPVSRSRVGVEITEIWNWGWSEYTKLTNTGDQVVEMGGWTLGALKEQKVFRFPLGFKLEPGQTVTIHSGANATLKQDPPLDQYWNSEPIWANRGDVGLLFDTAGNEVARYVYRMHGDPDLDAESEKRLIEDELGGYQFVDAGVSESVE